MDGQARRGGAAGGIMARDEGMGGTEDLLRLACELSLDYIRGVEDMPAFPSPAAMAGLDAFSFALPRTGMSAQDVLRLLAANAAPATTASTGGRYLGYVVGGILPVAHAASWLADTWNQNGGLFNMSPAVSRIEAVCERWMADILTLPEGTAMGLVTGAANALVCALAAARTGLYARLGWDVAEQGLVGAPAIRVVLGAGAHATVFSALALLGMGRRNLETVPVDAYGRMRPERLPPLDERTLLVLQAGNVVGGAYDPLEPLLAQARRTGAWAHVDGAFGLWAAASRSQRHHVAGLHLADSWSLDGHKTLNVGYDCGVVLCRDRDALARALGASGACLDYGAERDGMRYATEMSRRARAIPLWATLAHLGKDGVEALVDHLCAMTRRLALGLAKEGFDIVIPPFFNQFILRMERPERTRELLRRLQEDGTVWCNGADWEGEPVIRASICSHATSEKDMDAALQAFLRARERMRP